MSAAALKILKGLKAFKAAMTKSSDGSNGRPILAGILGLVLFILMLPILAISLPGLVGKTEETPSSFVLEETQIYQDVNETYMEYADGIDEKIAKRSEDLKKEYAYEVVVESKNKKGKKITKSETKYPEVIVSSNVDNLPYSLIFAYISTKYLDLNKWEYDSKEILRFIEDNLSYQETVDGSKQGTVYLTVNIKIEDKQKIAEKYFKDEKVENFLLSCQSFEGLDTTYTDGSYAEINLEDLVFNANGMQIPHFLQWDKKWGNRRYGNGTISSSACGPTCMAMIISYLTGQIVTPDMTAAWSMSNGYYVSGSGTSWDFFAGAAKNWNLKSQNAGKDYTSVVQALSNGNPVIASMAPGTFTKGGHFIVLRGVTADGKILVNDPNDNYRTKNYYKREFDLGLIVGECKNFWVISKT